MRAALTHPLDFPGLVPYGLPSVEYGAAPGAATAFVQTLDSNYLAVLHALFVTLTPDANVADRTLQIEFRDFADNVLVRSGAPVTVPASDTTSFSFQLGLGQPDWEVNSTVLVPLPYFLILPQMDFRVQVTNMQAGDTLTNVRFVWQRYYGKYEPVTLDY